MWLTSPLDGVDGRLGGGSISSQTISTQRSDPPPSQQASAIEIAKANLARAQAELESATSSQGTANSPYQTIADTLLQL